VFKIVGAVVALYVLYALYAGEVYAKRGWWGATSKRGEQSLRYWSSIVVYTILAVALFFVF
jgi:hypothetical protein